MSSSFEYATVLSHLTADGVRTITLDRPGSLNAMNRQLIDDVAAAFEDAHADTTTRAIVFTGAGRAFCAGDDRREHVHPQNEEEARDLVLAIQQCTEAIMFGAKPVVGAINGWAVGGGFEWAINCDFPIWAETARGFFPEVSLNLFVTGAVSSLLPALVGLNTARDLGGARGGHPPLPREGSGSALPERVRSARCAGSRNSGHGRRLPRPTDDPTAAGLRLTSDPRRPRATPSWPPRC